MMLAIEALIAEHRRAHCPGTCRPAFAPRADHAPHIVLEPGKRARHADLCPCADCKARVQLLLAQEPRP